jgi:hypothetical protein
MARSNFASQSFIGSWVDFRGLNVNNSGAYTVAQAWKTKDDAFPRGVLGHRFVVSNEVESCRSAHAEQVESVETMET